jgi:curved DNA-binding protein CbpA
MFFKIDRGLFQFDFTDHHAILGVPIDANANDIRKRYLKIARRLHPDSCITESTAYKQRANQLLSKLVNPAYEKFSHERSRAEYIVLLKEMSKRLVKESASIELKSELSKQLNKTNNIEHFYKTLLYQLAEKQYESFDELLQVVAQISELNLVYLMRKGGKVFPSLTPHTGTNSVEKVKAPPPPPPPQPQESVVEQYLRRAEALIAGNNFTQARVELQDALKIEPNNSRCHSLIGVVYLKQNQHTMARIHMEKALRLNPKDPMALKGKRFLDQVATKNGHPTGASKSTQGKQADNSGGGSLFGGLFGGKKK